MRNLKRIALVLPEYLLIAAVIFYWLSAGLMFNPIAIGLIIGLTLQIIFKNRIVGIIIPSLLILTSFYMLFAVMSEFKEFPTFNSEAKKLLFVGLSYFISTMIVSAIMIFKYTTLETKKGGQLDLQH
ncbi:hypothetical protein [Carboxylicivirga marina]|uniref:hypothetical protein n=1 Tax=Carboxylicivirga marina TaxID=2800988 RepID=UPI00259949EC|nr:hypothetical protein [uncultured Carboxylicivirga sp.]